MGVGGVRTMEQRISAGNDFDGSLPVGNLVRADGLEKYMSSAAGGLFDFVLDVPHLCISVELKLGGQTSWTVHKRDADGDELLIICGTDETGFLTTQSDTFVLTDKQKLVVRTVGAALPLIARVSLRTVAR